MAKSILIFGFLTFAVMASLNIIVPALIIAAILITLGVIIFLLWSEDKPRSRFDPLEQAERLSKNAKDKAHLN